MMGESVVKGGGTVLFSITGPGPRGTVRLRIGKGERGGSTMGASVDMMGSEFGVSRGVKMGGSAESMVESMTSGSVGAGSSKTGSDSAGVGRSMGTQSGK
jgi:hypothetical protein